MPTLNEQAMRHATGSAVPGRVQADPLRPQAPTAPPARTQDRRGVADTPSAPIRHSAARSNASSAPVSRDDDLQGRIEGWQGAKTLDYWKLKAESADRAAKRSRGIDPDTRRGIGEGASSGRPTGGGGGTQNVTTRSGDSGGSGRSVGDSGESRSFSDLSESGSFEGTPDFGGAF